MCARLLYAITSAGIGGAEIGLLRWIAAHGDDVAARLVVLKGEGAIASAVRARGVSVACLGIPDGLRGAAHTRRAVDRLARIAREEQPDVLHAVLLRAGYVAVAAARRAGGPGVVVTLTSPPRAAWRLALARWMRGQARFVAVSESVRRAWAPALGARDADVAVIANGVETTTRVADGERTRAAAAWPLAADAPLRLLAVGRLVPEKGWDDLLAAFEAVAAARPEATLLLLGDGPLRARLEQRIAARGLGGRARIGRETLAVAAHMAAADLFVHAARDEGLPTVLLEAMAAAKPVVATEAGGSSEAVVDGVCGRVVPAAAPARLAAALLETIADPARRAAFGRAGRERVVRHFTVEETARRYRELYASLRHPERIAS